MPFEEINTGHTYLALLLVEGPGYSENATSHAISTSEESQTV